MLRHPFFTFPVFVTLALLSATAVGPAVGWFPFSFLKGAPLPSATLAGVLLLHGIAAVGSAFLAAWVIPQATLLTRLTLLVFFLVFTLSMPVLGILIAAAIATVLRRPTTGGLRPEERFVFGNPEATAARRASPTPPPSLIPLADGIRQMDEETLCRAILGLKHLGPTRSLMPFLLRFQQDPRTSVQFSAQAVLSQATETLEEAIRTLRQRLTGDLPPSLASTSTPCSVSDKFETSLALADTLEQLAAWTPPGDATASIRRRESSALVSEILATHPKESRALRLFARLQLAANHGLAAQTTAAQLAQLDPAGNSTAHQMFLESLFHQARWEDLTAAARLSPPAPGQAELHQFWTGAPSELR